MSGSFAVPHAACHKRPPLLILVAGLALLALGCGDDGGTGIPAPGGIDIRVVTSGPEPDADGYIVLVDNWSGGAIGVNGSRYYDEIEPGYHAILLEGLAANCTVAGDNPRTVAVAAGESVTVEFQVTCGPTTGSLRLSTTTTGPSPDPDGYTIAFDGTDLRSIGVSETVNLPGLAPGAHQLELSGLAANCTVEGDNPRAVSIVPGQEAELSFAVTCVQPPPGTGTLTITTSTTGEDVDPDGYRVRVDAGTGQPIGINGTLSIANLAAGSHSVRLVNVATNCTVAGENPRAVTITSGATTQVSFAISCARTTGAIQVTTTTTGTDPDPGGYLVALGQATPIPIATTGSHTLEEVPAGTHQVKLTGVAANCRVEGENPQEVSVTAGATASVAFAVTCVPIGVTRWTAIPLPQSFSASGLWASSPSDIYVTGQYPGTAEDLILHYDGSTWTEQARIQGYLMALWGRSPSDVFAVGHKVLRYDGVRWLDIWPEQIDARFDAVWGSSAGDLFVGGLQGDYDSPALAHYDGGQWSEITPWGVISGFGRIAGIVGSSPNDLYIIVNEWAYDDVEYPFTMAVVHFNGTSWTRSFEKSYYDHRGSAAGGIWAGAHNNVFVVTLRGEIIHYDGSNWSSMASPTTAALRGVWGRSEVEVYAVGGAGVLRYDSFEWKVISSTPATNIWGTPADLFVATEGAILHGTR